MESIVNLQSKNRILSRISSLLLLILLGWNGNIIAQTPISSATITVNSAPVAADSIAVTSGVHQLCNNTGTTLSVAGGSLGSGGAVWKWYEDGCGAGTALQTGPSMILSAATLTNNTNGPITHTYFVRAEVPSGGACPSTICKSTTITVNPTPSVVDVTDIVACSGAGQSAITFTGQPTGIVAFNVTGGNTSVDIANATGISSMPAFTPTNTTNSVIVHNIQVTPVAYGCEGSPIDFNVSVLPQINLIATSDTDICNGSLLNVIPFSSNVPGTTFAWTNDLTSIGLGTTGSGNISFDATNTNCTDAIANVSVFPSYTSSGLSCTGIADVFSIKVYPTPNGTLVAGNAVCEGEPAPLIFDATCGLSPWTLSMGIGAGVTTPTTDYSGITDLATIAITPVPGVGNTTYNLMKIVDANGCENPN